MSKIDNYPQAVDRIGAGPREPQKISTLGARVPTFVCGRNRGEPVQRCGRAVENYTSVTRKSARPPRCRSSPVNLTAQRNNDPEPFGEAEGSQGREAPNLSQGSVLTILDPLSEVGSIRLAAADRPMRLPLGKGGNVYDASPGRERPSLWSVRAGWTARRPHRPRADGHAR